MIIRQIFSKRFLLLKDTYELSYSELAFMVGAKNKTTVNEWIKSQKGFPNETMLVLIADIFAVPTDWLLGRIKEPYNEMLLFGLEEQHALSIYELALGEDRLSPLPEMYRDADLRRKNYSLGQRANLIYAAMSSFYKTVFARFTLKQIIEEGDVYPKTVNEMLEIRNLLNENIAGVKDIGPLLRGELDKPVFDLEAVIKQGQDD